MRIINDVHLLCLDTGIKLSPISDGVVEIQISIHHAMEKPDNMMYAEATWFKGPHKITIE
jgi:hypothetical protein